jgi:hypothetical protein
MESDSDPFTYQWRKEGSNLADDGRITGATSPVLFINPVEASDTGTYDVVVINECGFTISEPVILTMLPTRLYADIFPKPDGDGNVDLDDILKVLDGFADPIMHPNADIYPCVPDGEINLDDILAVLDAFAGFPACPDYCPP